MEHLIFVLKSNILVKKHCQITNSLSCYNIYNNDYYIQELISDNELEEFLSIIGGKLTKEKLSGVKLPKSKHAEFYKL